MCRWADFTIYVLFKDNECSAIYEDINEYCETAFLQICSFVKILCRLEMSTAEYWPTETNNVNEWKDVAANLAKVVGMQENNTNLSICVFVINIR